MVIILIQSRLGSTRLPMKALLPLGDSTALGQVIRRCKRSKADKVVVVTKDPEIAEIAHIEGVEWSITPTDGRDVLAEMYIAAKSFKSDIIVRITGDCPCVSPKEINNLIDDYKEMNKDIICNHSDAITGAGIDGLDIEVFSFEALETANDLSTVDYDREHVTPYMYRNMTHDQVFYKWDFDKKLSIDTKEDYKLVFHVFEKLGNEFETREIVNYLKEIENE